MFKSLTQDQLEDRIDAVSETLAASPKDRVLYRELANLLQENEDRRFRVLYQPA
jgi:hypothetical protein